MEVHEACSIFPEMAGDEYENLKADIAENGLRQAIWTFRGKLLEGRARYRACRELGVQPRFQEWGGDDDDSLVAFVVSLNLQRRHLTASQKAMCATVAEKKFAEEAERRVKARARERTEAKKRGEELEVRKKDYKDWSANRAGDLVGVNGNYVVQAKKVQAHSPELAEKVRMGQLTLPQASREVKRHEKRRELEKRASQSLDRSEEPWAILQGDCVKLLGDHDCDDPRCIGANQARLIFADPPYNIGIDYGDHYDDSQPFEDFKEWCGAWISAAGDKLTWDGSLFLLVDWAWSHDLAVLGRELGLHIRQTIVWYETFGVNCSRKYNRCSRPLIWFTKHKETFAWNPEAVNRPSDRQLKYNDKRADPNGKTWDDVWGINPPIPRLVDNHHERIPDFPTQLPLDLLRPIVGCHSDPGDLVLDPFSGSGTTGCACVELGRRFIGIELSEKFAELSRKRILIHSSKGGSA
jgi:site-specific DNA-methyltransferase (adenine-specific)